MFSIFDVLRVLCLIDLAATKALIGHPTIASRMAEELLADTTAAAPPNGAPPQPTPQKPPAP